ncbi:Fic family protein [Shewanella sp. C32]|uniref:protein adenylyltransferase n=1 Tax=Shewanella electrica TaxID=515560 RepID=A0ABT2FHX5_9GAMM|nr:Fic family protein [Shewanella electrica]MCH1924039.1 Fic family protein [Shewanella electrica]MCS4555942.1 Fic family protein [Shewanella electrica]
MQRHDVAQDKYGVAQDKYCYPNSGVLINLLHIHRADELAAAEAAFSAERYRTYNAPILTIEDFTFHHLCELHYYLFHDVYAWAGKIRDVDIAKGTTRFCHCDRIAPEADKLFAQIPSLALLSYSSTLIEAIADLYCEINLLHPFREGNGRAQRFFFEEMLFCLGFEVHWPHITKAQWVDANIAGVHLDLGPLIEIFEQSVTPLVD